MWDELSLPTTGYAGVPASHFGLTTHPQRANIIKEVSDKLSSGIKVIEITAISPQVLEAIPEQHLEEVRRLKELTGAELTFHGPIIEATGFDVENRRWDPLAQKRAERQMWSAVERSQKLNPDGNTVVTFHSTAALPEMQTTVKGEEGVKQLLAYDEFGERIASVPVKPNYLEKDEKPNPQRLLKEVNENAWEESLSDASYHANRGKVQFENVRTHLQQAQKALGKELKPETILEIYKDAGTPEGQKRLEAIKDPAVRGNAELILNELNHGDLSVRRAYHQLQELFNRAWVTVKNEEDRKRLEEYREHFAPQVKENNLKNPENVIKFADEVSHGLQLLSTLKEKPALFSPLQDVAIKKASETFSNVALKAFKEFGEHAPIISIENPPAGGGLSRGGDIRELVEKTRERFVEQAVKELHLSESEAKQQAEKLIGVTWDVGHINMLRQFGYGTEDIIKETEKVAPLVKHVHLSDNFGIQHTELPMGMGNVPTKEQLELIEKYNKQAKKIIETGDWWNQFQRNPLPDTLQAFGSPIYAMKMAPYWNQARGVSGGYFSGLGLNPDIHNQVYGSGFSMLPVELGGQMTGRNRLSGAPMDG